MIEVDVYTDGSCFCDQDSIGYGGWASIIKVENKLFYLSGFSVNVTNNRMELKAIVETLSSISISSKITVFTDSNYIVEAFKNNRVGLWKERQWIDRRGRRRANIDLWKRLLALVAMHQVEWIFVKSHSGNQFNSLCDKIAKDQAYYCKTKYLGGKTNE